MKKKKGRKKKAAQCEEMDAADFIQGLIKTIEISRNLPIEPERRAEGTAKFSRFFIQHGFYDEAIKYAGEASELVSFDDYPQIKTEALVCIGDAYRHKIPRNNLGDMEKDSPFIAKALEYYDQVLERDPDNALANFGKGLILFDYKDYENARICFEKTIKMDSSIFEAYNNLAICMSRQGNREGAEKLYRKALEIKPDDVKTLVNLGNHYFETEQYALCIEPYKKLLELDAAEEIHTNRLMAAYMHEGMSEKAEKLSVYEAEKGRIGRFPPGVIFLNGGKYDETIEYYKDDLINGSGEKMKNALYFTGRAYSGKQDYNEALKLLEQARTMDPDDDRVIRAIGNVYRDTDKYTEAEKCYRLALSLDPEHEGLLLDLADIYHKMENHKQAAIYYERFLKFEDYNAPAWYNLGLCYLETGKPGKVDKCFKKASESETIAPELLLEIGNKYYDLKKYKKAIEYYKKCLEMKPDNEEALCNIREALDEMGNTKRPGGS
jgi:tetratricopeptide (TPR) repeat protein